MASEEQSEFPGKAESGEPRSELLSNQLNLEPGIRILSRDQPGNSIAM